MSDAIDRVVPLDQLDDYYVAEGDPDVRGWKVMASDGKSIGSVDNLLIDTEAMKVRYLDVDLEAGIAGESGEDRHILVPIGYARLDEAEDNVFIDSLSSSELHSMPLYDHGPVTREFESDVRGKFEGRDFEEKSIERTTITPERTETDFYASETFDEDRFYSPRRESRDNPLI